MGIGNQQTNVFHLMPCPSSFKMGTAKSVAWSTQISDLEDNLRAFAEIHGGLICERVGCTLACIVFI